MNIDTIGTRFQKEVHTHERIHNAHEARWGKIDIPGNEFMTSARKDVIFTHTAELGETELVEGLTQYATQQRM